LLPFELTVIIISTLISADTLRLSLDDCLSLAMKQGPAAMEAFHDSVAAAGQWHSIAGSSYPQLRFSGELPSRREATDYQIVYDPATGRESYERIGSADETWSGRLELEQALPWGATASVSSRVYRSRWHNDRLGAGRDTLEHDFIRRFQLDQPIWNGNPVGRERRIGQLEWEGALVGHTINLRAVRYQVTQAFFGLVSAEGELEIARQDLEQGRAAEELAQRKLKAGLSPEVELLQIQVDLARREGSYRSTEASLESARDQLRLQLGLPFEQPLEPVWTPDDSLVSEYRIHSGLSGLNKETPELRRQRLSLEQTELENRAARRLERLKVSLQLYYEVDTRRHLFEDLDQTGDQNRGAMLTLNLPLFGFGTTSGKLQQLKAQLARARIGYQSVLAEAASELRRALREVELARDRIRIADAALDLSQRSYDITSGRYDSGLVGSRDLLDAQLALTRTRTEALKARIDYQLAVANLERMAPFSEES
jgi:outer membrane protein TolC